MRKLLLVLILAVVLLLPTMASAGDSKGIDFVSASAWGVFPAFMAAGNYDPAVGVSFLTETKIGERATLGINYTRWQIKGENLPDLTGNYIGLKPTYWVYPLDKTFNLYVNAGAGYSKIDNDDSTSANMGLISGLGIMYKITHGTHVRLECSIAKYGKEEDAFDVSLGLTFAL